MLVLSRFSGEEIIIGGNIRIVVTEIRCGQTGRNKVRIGIEAPKEMTVHRKEIAEAIAAERREKDSEANPGIGEDFA